MQLAKLPSPSHLDGPARKTTINGTASYSTLPLQTFVVRLYDHNDVGCSDKEERYVLTMLIAVAPKAINDEY